MLQKSFQNKLTKPQIRKVIIKSFKDKTFSTANIYNEYLNKLRFRSGEIHITAFLLTQKAPAIALPCPTSLKTRQTFPIPSQASNS